MNMFLEAAQSIDNALHVAYALTSLKASGEMNGAEFLYGQMRAHIMKGLDALRDVGTPEVYVAYEALDWVLAHLLPYEELSAAVRVDTSPYRLDPRLHPFATAHGRAQWLHETQRERLILASLELRDIARHDITP